MYKLNITLYLYREKAREFIHPMVNRTTLRSSRNSWLLEQNRSPTVHPLGFVWLGVALFFTAEEILSILISIH